MFRTASRVALAALLFTISTSLFAATYLVPSDREMIQRSDDIVVATAIDSIVVRTPVGGIVTKFTLRIEDVLKGDRRRGGELMLTELGGLLSDFGLTVAGTPLYVPGVRYLVFTNMDRNGDLSTFGMELGQFRLEKDDAGRLLAVRNAVHGFDGNLESFRDQEREAGGFIRYIRGIVAQRIAPKPTYFVDAARRVTSSDAISAAVFTRRSYLLGGGPRHGGTPGSGIVTAGTQPGADGPGAVSNGIAAWNSTGVINYSYNGQDNTANKGFTDFDGKDAVLFNDPNGELSSPILGRGGVWQDGTQYMLDGEFFNNVIGIDVVIDNAIPTGCMLDVMTHELGHTLGFRHSNQDGDGGPCGSPLDCSGDAIMNSSVSCSANGQLKNWDNTAAQTVYGSGPVCTPPSISGQPQNQTITDGESTSLNVTAAGSSPFSYQWYIGNPPSTAQPTGTNSSQLNVSPTTTTSYWVRVTGQCDPPANSNAATVTVNPFVCVPPSIQTQPANQTIFSGGFTVLSVSPGGSGPFSYQWFIGDPPNTAQPTGGNSSSLGVGPAQTTTYWVRVSGRCDPPAISNGATVTVEPCPAVDIGTPTATLLGNNSYSLSIGATSGGRPLTFSWFRGNTPGGDAVFVGSGTSVIVPPPTGPTSYWARVANDCGQSVDSVLVTISNCVLATITTQPADQIVPTGSPATLTVAFTSPGETTARWYRGVAQDKRNPAGVGNSITVGPLTATTSYWASITNSCGEVPSRTATITVCKPPVIASITPASASIGQNKTVTLVAIVNGDTPLTLQWYEGAVGITSKPVGTNSTTFTSVPLTKDTQFWLKATNACGTSNSSNAVRVEVKPAKRREVRH